MRNLPERILAFDTETSGVNVAEDRILTCYAAIYDQGARVVPGMEWSWTIDPGIEIPEGASNVHGMTTEWVRENGRKDAGVAVSEIYEVLRGAADRDIPIVAFNIPYDFTLLHYELIRHGLDSGVTDVLNRGIFYDPLVHEKARDKYVKGAGQRKLGNMCKRNGVKFNEEEAHAAEYDVRKTAELTWKFFGREKKGLADLQKLLPQWHQEQASGFEEYARRVGRKNDAGEEIRTSKGWPLSSEIGN